MVTSVTLPNSGDPGRARDLYLYFPGPLPSTAFDMIAFLSDLSAIPSVLCAAALKAALVIGCPAPGARRDRVKTVRCFLAAVAISMWPPGTGASAVRTAGVTLYHCAGNFLHLYLVLHEYFY